MPRHTSAIRPTQRPQVRALERQRERETRRTRRDRQAARKSVQTIPSTTR